MKTRVRASRWKLTLGENPATLNHVHKFWLKEYPGGGEEIKVIPIMIVNKADIPTEPAPIRALICLDILFPPRARIKNPAKGRAGINHRTFSISLQLKLTINH